MDIQFYLERLRASGEFKKFMKENPDAYICSCFFVIDLENPTNPDDKYQIDFFSKKTNQLFSFNLEDEIKLVPLTNQENAPILERISAESELDFKEIEMMIFGEMGRQNIKNKMQKIIMVLQNNNGKDLWICTVFISGLGLLKVNIDDSEKKITLFEKRSFLDMFKKF
ncbi:MAG: hypothetical protein AABW81_00550 [Nanoarchaeota archaeon]